MRRIAASCAVLVLAGAPASGTGQAAEQSSLRLAAPTALPLRLPPGTVDSVSWSHDGRWLAVVRYVSGRPKGTEVRLIRRDGAGQERAVVGRLFDLNFVWSRKSSAYATYEQVNGLLFTGVPGQGATRVGGGYGSLDPTGRRLAFVSNRTLYLADRLGRRRVRLSDAAGPVEWSPDGKQIVFGRRVERSCGIKTRLFLIRPNGTGQRPVTSETRRYDGREVIRGEQRLPQWSPDGRRLLVHEQAPCGYSEIGGNDPEAFVLQPRSSRPEVSLGQGTATWSPSGRRIASYRRYTDARGLSIVSPDGRFRSRTVEADAGRPDLSWSPDGRRIAFKGGFPEHRLFVMRADGTGLRALTKGESELPAWSPRGDRIVFVQRSTRCGEVLLSIAPSGQRLRALTRC